MNKRISEDVYVPSWNAFYRIIIAQRYVAMLYKCFWHERCLHILHRHFFFSLYQEMESSWFAKKLIWVLPPDIPQKLSPSVPMPKLIDVLHYCLKKDNQVDWANHIV